MSAPDQPTRNNKRKMPPEPGSASSSLSSRPETGATYFETDKVDRRRTGEDTEMQDTLRYGRARAKTRGHKEHPGRRSSRIMRAISISSSEGDNNLTDEPKVQTTVRETGVESNFLEPVKRTQISYRRHRNHSGCKSNHIIHVNSEIDDDLTDDDFEIQATFARGADASDFDIPELAKRAQSSKTEETSSETDDELTEEDLEMQAAFGRTTAALEPDVSEPVKRTRARTRGQKQHPSRKPYGMKCTRRLSLLARQPSSVGIEDSITVAPVLDGPTPVSMESPTSQSAKGRPASGLAGDLIHLNESVDGYKTYSHVIPQDESEPVAVSKEDLDELQKQEEVLENLYVQQAEWRIGIDELDKKILDGLNELRYNGVAKTRGQGSARSRGRRRGGRRSVGVALGKNIDALKIRDMNASIAMVLATEVLSRQTELSPDDFEAELNSEEYNMGF